MLFSDSLSTPNATIKDHKLAPDKDRGASLACLLLYRPSIHELKISPFILKSEFFIRLINFVFGHKFFIFIFFYLT